MPRRRRIRQGEDLDSIAARSGCTAETIWDHPDNAELKKRRKDPNVLQPGDILVVPEIVVEQVSGGTETRHRFRRKAAQSILRLQIQDEEGPRANLPYVLEIDGHFLEGQTDGDGQLEHPIPLNARQGFLMFEGEDPIPLDLAALDPVDTPAGAQARLMNLGYDCGEIDEQWSEEALAALTAFQRDNSLEPSGTPDPETLDRLLEAHGS